VQHIFVLFYYVEELVKGLLDLAIGMLGLRFKLKVCCAFVLIYYLHMHCAYCWCSYSLLGLDQ
jgi:hypothetical protein